MFISSTDVKKAISISMLRTRSRWKCIVEAITRTAVGVSLVICASIASSSAQQQAPAAVPVGTVKAEHKAIAKTKDFVGRVEAINKVEVHARVTGYLEDVQFKEGEFVKEGQHLYTIEKDQFQAAVDQAAGELADDKAKKLLTAIEYQRAETLAKTSAGTIEARDKALTADRHADAQILIAQGKLDTANINFGYTDIVSPIAGKIGRGFCEPVRYSDRRTIMGRRSRGRQDRRAGRGASGCVAHRSAGRVRVHRRRWEGSDPANQDRRRQRRRYNRQRGPVRRRAGRRPRPRIAAARNGGPGYTSTCRTQSKLSRCCPRFLSTGRGLPSLSP